MNTSANSFFSLDIKFSVADEHDSAFLQNVDIGKSHKLNSCIQFESNRFSVFLSRYIFNFFVLPSKVTLVITSPSKLIYVPLTAFVVLWDLNIVGFCNFFQVLKFRIVGSDPESNWNLISLPRILTVSSFRKLSSWISMVFVRRTRLLVWFLFLQWELLCPIFCIVSNFCEVWAIHAFASVARTRNFSFFEFVVRFVRVCMILFFYPVFYMFCESWFVWLLFFMCEMPDSISLESFF